MDIECVQVLKTLKAGKKTIQPGIYHAPLDRVLIDEVRAKSRVVIAVDSKNITASMGSSVPVSSFKNEIKRLSAICDTLKSENETLKEDLKEETDALERCSETFVESASQCKELEAENEKLRGEIVILEENTKVLLDKNDSQTAGSAKKRR